MKVVVTYLKKHQISMEMLLLIVTTLISIFAIEFFLINGNQNLGNYDAVARLNIARKITDSLTPGVGQLGGVWLPFPQILMIPLVRIDFLYHTGLAGSIVSGLAFILGAVFLYKTAYLITKKVAVSVLVWFMYVANINIIFLQTMALSEVFFMTSLIMILYYLTKWTKTHHVIDLLATGFFVVMITLTRYEGYFVFIGAAIAVFIETMRVYWKESWQKKEGTVLLYLTVACFGILAWCIYCFLFYNDFLHWLHLYSEGKSQVSTATVAVTDIKDPIFEVVENSLPSAFQTYSDTIMWMNGKITVFLSLFGLAFLAIKVGISIAKKKVQHQYIPLLIVSIVLFAFLVYGYHKGFIPTINLPPKPIPPDAQKSFTIYSDSNIRYGIILAPSIVLLAGFAAAKHKMLFALVTLLFSAQLFMNVYKPQMLQYSLPVLWPYSTLSQIDPFKALYDDGLILISSNAHEDFMFQTRIPYSRFIYEGSREYWMESLQDPSRHAKWVIYDDDIQGDAVYYFLTEEARTRLQTQYDLVYDVNGFKIWRLR